MSETLPIRQLGSDRDPVGSVYEQDGRILRGVRAEFEAYYRGLLEQSPLQQLLGEKIVPTAITPDALPGYALTLEHKCISPASYPFEWAMPMLKDAALLTLDICLALNESGAVLKDGTPWNVLFDGPRPLMVDFTSIMPQDEDLAWVAYDQFCRQFLFPLLVGRLVSGRVSRALLLDAGAGVSHRELPGLLPGFSWLRYGWLVNRLYIPSMLVNMLQKSGQEKEFASFRQKQKVVITPAVKQNLFESLRKDVLSIRFNEAKSAWSRYYDDINTFFTPGAFNEKQKVVAGLLQRCKPRRVVDIGCNQGGYAVLAANAGARVVAFDNDEDSVSLLYRLANERKLDILPLMGDVLTPAPLCGWRAQEFSAAPQRYRSDMALALALVHHLVISQNQTFERVVKTLADYSRRWLITEFVPLSDPRSQEISLTNRRDLSWYTLDNFLAALKSEFANVQTFPSYPTGRTLCFCER